MTLRLATLLPAVLFSATALAADPEFEGNCAMSVSLGARLPTDCSVVWISPEDKLYCFSSEQAKAAFMRDPVTNEQRAQSFWRDPNFWEQRRKERDENG
jgi:hypothetical protein